MNEKIWKKAKELFHEARSLPANQRGAFLDEQCLDDPALREQVDELLGFYDSEFLESPPLANAQTLLDNDNFAPGRVIGRYHIRELIGTGGMGQVFRADDTELNRPVAFKVLHEDVAGDQERVRRFIQEARAASALNHPNILTIYEIGTFETARFIVSEYIDGETLRERMRGGLTSAESLDIMCQVATALQAAHSAGIVHRDIKPENIMLRQDGLVKVLDFGLAKLTENRRGDAETQRRGEQDNTLIAVSPRPGVPVSPNTEPGLIMGTVAYMSPEQARGQAVDSRTDLWSLGVVFHEMLTGESPFKGDSVTDLVTSILKHDPASLDLKSISQELKPICTKALAKDKKARYQTAQDLLQDLQGEKKRMEYAIQGTPFVTVSSTDEMKTQLIRRRPTLSAEYIVTSVKRHKYATLGTIVLIFIAAFGLSVYKYNGATPPASEQSFAAIDADTTEKDLKFSKLPISAQAADIVISPDGKHVAYLVLGQGIKLLDLETSTETELVPKGSIWGLTFSPDSKFVYYSYGDDPNGTAGFKRVSVQGGSPVNVVDNPDDGPAFTRDGLTMAFTREIKGGLDGEVIVLANPDGSNERTIAKTGPDNLIWGGLVFSPDGKTLACPMRFKDDGTYAKLIGFSVVDGKQTVLSDKKWTGITGAVWLPNGNLVVTAKEMSSETLAASQLWLITPDGQARAITSGLIDYQGLSATRDGDVLLTHQARNGNDLWVLPNNDASKARQVTTSGELRGGFNWTPDGRVVMGSNVSGNLDLWIMKADGSGRKQLTHEVGLNVQPTVSPDGKYIVFSSDRVKGKTSLFRMDLDGGNVKQLTSGMYDNFPRFSGDGKWIYYIEIQDGKPNTVRKISVNGGEAITVATPPDGWELRSADINRSDGRLAYMLVNHATGARQVKLAVLTNGTTSPKMVDLPTNLDSPVRWTPDGRMVAMLGRGPVSSAWIDVDVWQVPLDGKGKPRPITDFRTPSTYNFNWSGDGKQMLVGRGTLSSDPVLIRGASK